MNNPPTSLVGFFGIQTRSLGQVEQSTNSVGGIHQGNLSITITLTVY
jgi:hypothetical protein